MSPSTFSVLTMLALVYILILLFSEALFQESLFNVLQTIEKNDNFTTLVVFRGSSIPNFSFPTPKLITSKNFKKTPNHNENKLTLVFMDSLDILDFVDFHLHDNLDSKILIISSYNLTPETIFQKCYSVDLPNVILKANESFFIYCFRNPITVFPISSKNIFKKPWMENDFLNYSSCQWDIEIISRSNTLGQYKELIKAYGDKLNGNLKIVTPEKQTLEANLVITSDNLNVSNYKATSPVLCVIGVDSSGFVTYRY